MRRAGQLIVAKQIPAVNGELSSEMIPKSYFSRYCTIAGSRNQPAAARQLITAIHGETDHKSILAATPLDLPRPVVRGLRQCRLMAFDVGDTLRCCAQILT